MGFVKIATRTVSKVAVIELATRDVVAVEVVLAEVDVVAVVMTATLVVSPSTHRLIFTSISCTNVFLKATTSSKPTNHGAHLPANPSGKMNKQGKPSLKLKKKTKVQLVDGIRAVLPSPPMQLPQLTLTVLLRPKDPLPPMLRPKQSLRLSPKTIAGPMPTTLLSRQKRN